ncbi:MAG: hypothetical protein WCY77_09935 [Weeksellaceae bacterium]
MAKFTPYALSALPTSGIDVNGLYFIKGASSASFNIFIRKGDNSDWVTLGTVDSVDSVNGLTGGVKVDLEFTAGKLKILATGAGTAVSVTEINLDAAYRKIGVNIDWSEITGIPNFALDSAVVHIAGAETITGAKTFSTNVSIPLVPTGNAHSTSKKYVDDADANLQTQITNISNAIDAGLKTPEPLDCSTNPNYPASEKGDTYKVTNAGKVGGSSGETVEVGDLIICTVTNSGGTQAAVGANFFIMQSNIDQATETVPGFARIATQAQTDSGTDDLTIITPKKLQKKITDNNTSQDTASNGKYVRYDASQTLSTANKTTARTNIGAADDAVVVKTTGNQSIAGTKTFTTIPVLPNSNPTTDNQSVRKKYVDDTIASAVAWGGTNGKEW